MSAVAKVFNIPELLTFILANTPPISLLQLQRVNRIWYDAIRASPELQSKLFFKADLCDMDSDIEDFEWNPFCSLYSEQPSDFRDCCAEMRAQEMMRRMQKPDSWKAMHITKPSSTQVRVSRDEGDGEISSCNVLLKNDKGVKLGDLGKVRHDMLPWEDYDEGAKYMNVCVKGLFEGHSDSCGDESGSEDESSSGNESDSEDENGSEDGDSSSETARQEGTDSNDDKEDDEDENDPDESNDGKEKAEE